MVLFLGEFIADRVCYLCNDAVTIPNEFSKFRDHYCPFLLVCVVFQLVCIPFQAWLLCAIGKLQQHALSHLFYPKEALFDNDEGPKDKQESKWKGSTNKREGPDSWRAKKLSAHASSVHLSHLRATMTGESNDLCNNEQSCIRRSPNVIVNATQVLQTSVVVRIEWVVCSMIFLFKTLARQQLPQHRLTCLR